MPEPLLSLAACRPISAVSHPARRRSSACRAGGLTMLLGRNGAGKTTTLRTIMGLWRASAGEIRFDGRDIAGARHAGHRAARHRLRAREHGRSSPTSRCSENLLLAARAGPLDAARLAGSSALFPALEDVLDAAGGQPLGRPEADAARSRAPSIEPRKLHPDRRADQGPGAGHHRQHDRGFRELKRDGDDDPAGRAEFRLRPRARRHRRRDGRRRIVHTRHDGGARRRSRPAAAAARPQPGRAPMSRRHRQRIAIAGAAARAARRLAAAAADAAARARWRCRWSARPSTWVTLTVAGLAMGMMIFIMASGLTLIFGLMDVLNFGHGAFIALGAFVALTRAAAARRLAGAPIRWRSTSPPLRRRSLVAMVVTGVARASASSASSCGRSTASI